MQILFNAAYGAVLLLSGWILRTIWDAVKEMKADISEIERQLPSNYVRRDDYKDDIAEIKEFLREIFNKLDNKADK